MMAAKSRDFFAPMTPGFTLVEILLALVMTAMVAAAIYKTLGSQQKIYKLQNQAIELQQNLRAAMDVMAREIAMAGHHPPNCTAYAAPADAGHIVAATGTELRFTFDTADDAEDPPGDCDVFDREDIHYYLQGADLRRKVRFVQGGVSKNNTGSLISNIDGLEFCYVLANGAQSAEPANYGEIRAVKVTLLARSSSKDPDPAYSNQETYHAPPCGSIWGPFSDQHRRKLITTTVWCRNLGL